MTWLGSCSMRFMFVRIGRCRPHLLLAPSFSDVGCLRTFGALDDLEFDKIAFLHSAVTVSNDTGIMNKNISSIVRSDEAVLLSY